jgi:hypothetical protein
MVHFQSVAYIDAWWEAGCFHQAGFTASSFTGSCSVLQSPSSLIP